MACRKFGRPPCIRAFPCPFPEFCDIGASPARLATFLLFNVPTQRGIGRGDTVSAMLPKANEFPLHDEATRCCVPGAILENEVPRLLDPCVAEDCGLLAHGIDGELKPGSPNDTWEFERAEYTIRQLGLNAFNVPENKKNDWSAVDLLIQLGGNKPEVIDLLKKYLSESQEYSSFFRSAIGTHRGFVAQIGLRSYFP